MKNRLTQAHSIKQSSPFTKTHKNLAVKEVTYFAVGNPIVVTSEKDRIGILEKSFLDSSFIPKKPINNV